MTEIINARFRTGGKIYSFNPNGLRVAPGDGIMVSTTKGPEYAICTEGNHLVDETTLIAPLRPVLRPATEEDLEAALPNKEKERQAFRVCKEKIAQHGLDMNLVSAQYSPDGTKILFNFTAENRVDFRALVKDLASALHARIELRQIGVRDETRLLGGLGICGRPYCCCQFLDKFQPVSIKMAKTQSLSLNPTKISGACGRLMCCLKYEQGAYEDAARRCPKRESFVETPDGVGTVTEVNLLREKVKVTLEDGGEQPRTYYNQEIRVVRSGKGKRPEDYVAPPKAELEALRYIPPKETRPSDWEEEPRNELEEKLEDILSADRKRPAKPHRAQSPRQGKPRSGGHGSNSGGSKPRKKKAPPKEG